MLCFEVYRNGERLCTAGVDGFGLLDARVKWLSHEPEKLARWAAKGKPAQQPITLELLVGGCIGEGQDLEHLKWVEEALSVGDEIQIRVVEADVADAPGIRYKDEVPTEEMFKKFVREQARAFGWKIRE